MSNQAATVPAVVPAQLSFLAIYNPSLGRTDESVRDQIVFYSSKASRSRRSGKSHDGGRTEEDHEEENEKLRQVGLAQGMVDFAKNFSNGQPVDSIETEKSRIVLYELETNWWILASIDLTRLPSARMSAHHDAVDDHPIEYSSREVSPPQLLLQHLLRAHTIFLLHHGDTLDDLYSRHSRTTFCSLLDRFWTRFIWNWDVLLHGNPAVDIFDGIKLAAGGELGVGVGEEEWGSGEREVLEGFVSRTDGLTDLILSRFGDAPTELQKDDVRKKADPNNPQQDPWLGTDSNPLPSDGVLFSGVGAISKRSLVTVSRWMEWIYKYGEYAYGVSEHRTLRSGRKRRKLSPKARSAELFSPKIRGARPGDTSTPRSQSEDLRRKAIEKSSAPPGIPPPLVKAVEQSLDQATAKATSPETGRSPTEEKTEAEATEESSAFGTDTMMKYLSLGYGTSWTLSPYGLPRSRSSEPASRASESQSNPEDKGLDQTAGHTEQIEEAPLQDVDPTPELSDEDEPRFIQRLEQSIGKFLIGLPGDLENTEFHEDLDSSRTDKASAATEHKHRRIFVRTLTVEMAESHTQTSSHSSRPPSREESGEGGSDADVNSASGEARSQARYEQLKVAIYVHQPFMFVFLFASDTPGLSQPSFYHNIHHQLGPLQQPLLRTTNPANVAERIAEAMGERSFTLTAGGGKSGGAAEGQIIYDIVYDPERLSIHTSIPNIPTPGSPAAEGLGTSAGGSITVSGSWYTLGIPVSSFASHDSQLAAATTKSEWTRIEALNVHTQILNMWASTRQSQGMGRRGEMERTVKTGRGWWVLWMRVPRQLNQPTPGDREAFLVRKAALSARSENRSGSGGRWLLREQSRDVSAASSGGGKNTTAGVSEGVGVDARRWVEGLLSLNR